MRPIHLINLILVLGLLNWSCKTEVNVKDQVKEVIKNDPSIVLEALKSRPKELVEVIQHAARKAQEEMYKKRQEEEKKSFEKSFDNPIKTSVKSNEAVRGTKGAPLTLIGYEDFECPYCSRAHKTVQDLLKKYKGQIQFVFRHLPLDFHANAKIAAYYFEAINKQNSDQAWAFHDAVIENVQALKKGEAYLKSIVKTKLKGINMAKVLKDIKSPDIIKKVESDKKEAEKFGFRGAPGFLLNGIPIRGAQPIEKFDMVINELVKRKKVQLK